MSGAPLRVVRRVRRWPSALAVLLAVLATCTAVAVLTRPAMSWSTVLEHLVAPSVLRGVGVTVGLTVLVMVVGTLVGIGLAGAGASTHRGVRVLAAGYVWLFRSVPTLVQLLVWYNLALLFPHLGWGGGAVPGPVLDTNAVVTPLVAAVLGLGLSEGAVMGEIVRAGLRTVDAGQVEAARALGMTPWQVVQEVVLPATARAALPATGNELVGMLKYTSVASVISVTELLQSVQQVYSLTFEIVPLLMVATLWYAALTTACTLGLRRLERAWGLDGTQGDR